MTSGPSDIELLARGYTRAQIAAWRAQVDVPPAPAVEPVGESEERDDDAGPGQD
jgi:hypothetical protein